MSNLERLLKEYDDEKSKYQEFLKAVEYIVDNIINKDTFKRLPISSRVKERGSLERKILRRNSMYKKLNEISDIVGLRIITLFSDVIDEIADILYNEFQVIEIDDKKRDMAPDKFGYISLHIDIRLNEARIKLPEYATYKDMKAEIQIRSMLQHTWAEIEHDLGYINKTGVPVSSRIRRNFSQLASTLERVDEDFVIIKNNVKKYQVDLREKMDEKPKKVLIDNESITQFMGKNELAEKLDKEIAGYASAYLKSDDRYIDDRVSELIEHDINNISKLDVALIKHRDDIITIAQTVLEGKQVFAINKGISLLYLGYVLISKDQDSEAVVNYLNKFGLSYPAKRQSFAEELVKIWK